MKKTFCDSCGNEMGYVGNTWDISPDKKARKAPTVYVRFGYYDSHTQEYSGDFCLKCVAEVVAKEDQKLRLGSLGS